MWEATTTLSVKKRLMGWNALITVAPTGAKDDSRSIISIVIGMVQSSDARKFDKN